MLVRRLISYPRPWLACLLLAASPLAPLARGQIVTLAEPVAAVDELADVIRNGARLERERRWAEALSHYEEALRQHPDRPDLKHRATLARTHFDVCRRYNDLSYNTALRTLTERDALAIYDEVLLKVQSHYVHEPRWQQLVNNGQTNVEVAVTEPLFVSKHLPSATVEHLTAMQRDVRLLIGARAVSDRRQASDAVQGTAAALRDRYAVPAQAVILEFISGAAAALDEYSGFLTGSQMDEVFSQIEGNFVGLGVELKTEPAGLTIVNVIQSGPAYLGGIRPGDCITSVDGKTTADTSPDTLADMLRGLEGTTVDVIVRPASSARPSSDGTPQLASSEPRQMRLTRRRVEVPSVEQVKIVDASAGIGYFKLTSFQKTTARDVDAALWKLHEQGMRHLIIDLRGNPGGLLKAAVEVADRFVYDGLIVATRGRSPREDFDHKGEVAGTWRVPLVILIDHESASASEILAGAIRDHRRGSVVGEKSYGKGSVQGIFPLAVANVGIRLTTAKWYTPAGHAISGLGIIPDVAVKAPPKSAESAMADQFVMAQKPAAGADGRIVAAAADPILDAGLQLARTQASSRRMTP